MLWAWFAAQTTGDENRRECEKHGKWVSSEAAGELQQHPAADTFCLPRAAYSAKSPGENLIRYILHLHALSN